jgi:hypothetical protein
MKINFNMSNYCIAMDFYQSVMKYISVADETDVHINEIMSHLKHIVATDESPLAVKLRQQYSEEVFQFGENV